MNTISHGLWYHDSIPDTPNDVDGFVAEVVVVVLAVVVSVMWFAPSKNGKRSVK